MSGRIRRRYVLQLILEDWKTLDDGRPNNIDQARLQIRRRELRRERRKPLHHLPIKADRDLLAPVLRFLVTHEEQCIRQGWLGQ